MSAAPISAAEPDIPASVLAALARAGWPVEAWAWEQAMVAALTALARGDRDAARATLLHAQRLANSALPPDDLRRLTAAANLSELDGDRAALAGLAARWRAAQAWLTALRPQPRARSSLFHLRLESKHPGGYSQLQAHRLRRVWLDAADRLDAPAAGASPEAASAGARDAVAGWLAVAARSGFTDERKLAAAAGLLLPGRAAA